MAVAFQQQQMMFEQARPMHDGNADTTPLTATSSYWSSTQFDNTLAYMIYFPDGTPYLDFTNIAHRIRAVRRF